MRLDVYRGTTLAASLAYRRAPVYHGAPGERVRALLEAPRRVRNPWTGAWAEAPRADTPRWWLAGILGAGLGRAGFAIAATDAPLYGAYAARRGVRAPARARPAAPARPTAAPGPPAARAPGRAARRSGTA